MHAFRYAPMHIESLQAFAWFKPTYLPYAYRGIIAFVLMNIILLAIVHIMMKRRLQSFANSAAAQLQPVRIRI